MLGSRRREPSASALIFALRGRSAFSSFTSFQHSCTGPHSFFQLFARFLRFFKFSRLLHTHHDLFRKLRTGWLAGPNVAKCRQMHFCFATTGADPDVHEPRDNVRRNQRLNRPFQSSFLFSIFHFFVFFFSELSGTTPKNGFSPRLSPDGPAIAGRLDSSWQTVLCAPLFAQGWATCSSAEHGGWSSPPVCEPRQQACCRDRVVAERPRLDFANSLGGVAPPPFCSD